MSAWPHYRDPDLTAEAAMLAMMKAANSATAAVLASRRDLLAAGIDDTHPLCRVLDSFASCMTRVVTHDQISDPIPVLRHPEQETP